MCYIRYSHYVGENASKNVLSRVLIKPVNAIGFGTKDDPHELARQGHKL